MSDEFFPLASAKYVVKCYDISSGEHLTIWDDPRLGINYVAACREIIRLNEVIEGMRKESSTLVEQAESSQGGKWVMQSIPIWISDNDVTSVMTTTADSTMLYDQPPISFFRCPIHHCAIQNVRPGKWQCPECE